MTIAVGAGEVVQISPARTRDASVVERALVCAGDVSNEHSPAPNVRRPRYAFIIATK